jgi:AcrR family transcriptional regulator
MATQAEKTAATRQKLLDATIAVLVERGYKETSTPVICRRAGVSRGGTLHHFATKQALVVAAIEHLFSRRLAEIRQRLADTGSQLLDLRSVGTHLLAAYRGESFYAWLELMVAARTDRILRKHLIDLDRCFVVAAERLCKQFLTPNARATEVAAMTRLILAIFDGLAVHRIVDGDDVLPRRVLSLAARRGLFTGRGGDA